MEDVEALKVILNTTAYAFKWNVGNVSGKLGSEGRGRREYVCVYNC